MDLKSSLTTSYFKWQSTVISGTVSGNSNQSTATLTNTSITDSLINTGTGTAKVRYIVTAITDSGCISKPDTLYVIVQPKVSTANAGVDQKLCNATIATLTANTPATGNGQWMQIGLPVATITNANAASTTVSGLTGNNNYYFIWKIIGAKVCPASSDTVMIINRPAVTIANAGNDTTICNYNTAVTGMLTLHANADTSRHFETGTWSILSKPSGSTTSFSNINTATAVFSFNKTGLYQLIWTITNDNNCTPSTDTVNITVFEKPFAGNIIASTVAACAGSSVSFTLNNYTGIIYKWQYKTKANNNWVDSLLNIATITFNNVTDTISVRAITTSLSNTCAVYDTTASVATININPQSVAGVLSADSTICSISNRGVLHINHYVGNILYWQSSSDNGNTWNTINNTTDSLVYTNLSVTTKYRAYLQSGVCSSLTTNAVTIIVAQPVTLANAGPDRLLCFQDTIHLQANTPTIGTGNWQQISGPNTIGFSNQSNASTTVNGLTAGTYLFAWNISNNVCANSTDTLQITIRPLTTVANAGNDTIICNFTTATAIGLHGNINASRNFETGTWSIIAKPAGSNTSFSNVNVPNSNFNFDKAGVYQLVWTITNDNNCTPSTDTVNITVFEKPFAGNITASTVAACAGSSISFTLNNYIGTIYKWQYKTKANNNWIDSLLNIATITFNNVSDTISVRAITTSLSNVCAVYDTTASVATININPQTVAGVLSADSTICSISNRGVLHINHYVGNILYWQSSADNGNTWNTINNTTDSLVYTNLSVTTKYRAYIQSGVCSSLITNAVTITVAQPVTLANAGLDRLLCFQDTIHLQANTPTVGTGNWQQVSGPNTISFSNQSNPSTTVSTLMAGTYLFAWNISNNVCANSTDTVQITIQPLVINTIDTTSITVCSGQTVSIPGKSISGGNGTYNYQWQQSNDGISWNNISNADSANYSFTPAADVYIRRNVSSGACFNASNIAVIKVQQAITNNTISATQTVCTGIAADTLRGNTPIGGNNAFTYQWQQSSDSIAWNDIAGAVNKNHYAGIITAKTFYRRIVTSGACIANQQSVSNTISITINPNAVAGFSIPTLQNCEPFKLDSNLIKNNLSSNNKHYTWLLNDSVISNQNYFPAISLGSSYNNVTIKLIASSMYNCKADTAQQNITVLHKAKTNFTLSDTLGCGPLTVHINNITANITGYNYIWNFGNGQTSTQAQPGNIVFNYAASGHDTTYFISLKAMNVCDTVTATQKITVKRKALINVSANPLSGCSPLTVHFANQSVGDNVQYKLVFGDGTDSVIQSPAAFQHTYYAGNAINIPTVFIARNSCGTDSIINNIQLKPNPSIVAISGDSAVCGNSIALINQTKNANTFSWDFGDGNTAITHSTNDTIKHTYTSAGSYTVSVKISNGCSDTVVFRNVYLYPKPTINFTAPNNICIGDSVAFTNQSDTGYVFNWLFGDGNASQQINPVHSYQTAGNYIIALNAIKQYTYASCSTTISKPIHIIAQKAGRMQLSDSIGYCLPFTVTAINKGPVTTNTVWNFGDGNNATGDSVQHAYINNGKFIIHMKAIAAGGCAYVDSALVRITSPTGNLQTHAGYNCINSNIAFTASTNNTDSVIWNFGDGNIAATLNNIQHTYTKAGTYLVTAQLINKQGCIVKLPVVDTVKVDAVTANFNITADYECGKTMYHLTDSSSAYFGAANLLWKVNNTVAGNTKSTNLAYTSDGNHTVVLLARTATGCIDSAKANLNVLVHQFPQASINGIADACKSVLLNLGSSVISRDSVFYRLWDLGNGSSSKDTAVQVTYFSAGSYSVKLTVGTVNKCYDSALKALSIHPEPKVTLQQPLRICKGDTATLIANGAVNYIWKDAANNIICNNCDSIKVKPSINTTFNVIGYSQYGCSDVNSANINVVQPFVMQASNNDSICIGKTVQLFARGANSFSWYPATGLNTTAGQTVFATPATTTTYHVVGKDAYGCFADTSTITIKVGDATKLNIGKDTVLMSGNTYTFKPLTSRNDIVKWDWKGAAFSCNNCSTPTAKIIYDECISCTATNTFGCVSTDTICIKTFCPTAEIFVPNAFTPDGDGINDKLVVQGKGIKQVKSFRVFNRWGELVFERTNFNVGDPAYGWDGTIRGKAATPDVYVYVCEVICEKGYPAVFKGNTAILK